MTNDKTLTAKETTWRDLISAPAQNQTAVLAIYFFASCLVLPLANDTMIGTVYMLACVLLYYGMNRSLRALLQYALPALPLALFSRMLPGIPNAMVLPCAYVALLVGGGVGGFLLTHYHDIKRIWLVLAMPAAAYGAAALLTQKPLRALVALLPLAVALAAGICMLRCTACKDAVVVLASALAVTLIGAGALTLLLRGMLTRALPRLFAESFRAHITATLEQLRTLAAEAGADATAIPALSEETITSLVTSVMNIAPGIFLALCAIFGFLLWRSLLSMMVSFGSLPKLPHRIAAFSIGRMAGAVYLLSTLVSMIAGGFATTVGAICENLNLAMEPGLAMIGCVALFSKSEQRSCLTTVLAVGLIAMLFVDIFSALSVAALFGAVTVLLFQAKSPAQNDGKGE